MKRRKLQTNLCIILLVIGGSILLRQGKGALLKEQEKSIIPAGQDDLAVDFTANSTVISTNAIAKANLTFTNNGVNPITNISVDFGLAGEFSELKPTYPSHQEITTLNPGYSSSLYVELGLNGSEASDIVSNSMDVCLVIDASGSMQAEIDDVKAEFVNLVNRLTETIADLRVGVMVYGWQKYSEYPARDTRNYIELTTDYEQVNGFIQDLYAEGKTEPWGDALYLLNSWDWRANIPKLVIMVGDEDCDPGDLVGVGVTGDYYNGSQLLDAITNLKEKGIIISSVLSGDRGIVENQFNWIADYTNGECISLEELQSGENPISLPEQIEYWISELAREYFVYLQANITWIEVTGMGDESYELSEEYKFLVDITGPSTKISKEFIQQSGDYYLFDIYVLSVDISGTSSVLLFYTLDDISSELEPTWYFSPMTLLEDKKTYNYQIENLQVGSPLSFYVIAIDTVGNERKTMIYNETVSLTVHELGETVRFLFSEDNSTRSTSFSLVSLSLGTVWEAYLWIESDQFLNQAFVERPGTIIETIFSESNDTIYKIINSVILGDPLTIILAGNTSTSAIELRWVVIEESVDASTSVGLNEELSTRLIAINCNLATGYLSLLFDGTPLVAVAHVFDENWTKIGLITAAEALEVVAGKYYVWFEHISREGYLELVYDDKPYTNPDGYYTVVYGLEYAYLFFLAGLLLGTFSLIRTRKKKKHRN